MSARTLFLLFFVAISLQHAHAQSAEMLEAQARKTEHKNEKMSLLYRAAEKAISSDPKKASSLAHQSYNIALELNDLGHAAKAAYLNAEGYARQQKWGDAKFRFNRSRENAEKSQDINFAAKALSKMSEMARKEGNTSEANLFAQQAQELMNGAKSFASTEGGSTYGGSNYNAPNSPAANRPMPVNSSEMNALREQFKRQTEQLERDRQLLISEITMIKREKDFLSKNVNHLIDKEKDLSAQNQQTIQTLADRENQLVSISQEKEQMTRVANRKQKLVDALKSERSLDSIAFAQEKQEQELKLQKAQNTRNLLLLGLGFSLIFVFLIYNRFRENQKQKKVLIEKNRIIEDEQQRSDELLLNILPSTVAWELKTEGKAKAKSFEAVSVLFTDFSSFTKISEQLKPEQLVGELDTYFRAFDFIISQYKLEKIKTIGDAYMCADGLTGNRTTPINIVKAALEIQEFIQDMKAEKISQGEPYFEARIGIHTGPVVAGVVGVKKFAYDIWGDTVNIAARVQEACEPGFVNISEKTFYEVKYDFACRYRGKIPAKNKGDIDMYYVDKIL